MPTERRLYKLSQVIHQRQMDVVIALDHIHDQHNLSAVVRSADAAGFGRIIWTPDFKMTEKINPEISRGAERWVDLKVYEDLKPELLKLKSQGYRIVATHMARKAVDFRSVDWTKPSVVIFGNEHRGVSDDVVEIADDNIFLPMLGFVQSLNISVAAAVTLYEIQRQREVAGMYSKNASEEQVRDLYAKWNLMEDHVDVNSLIQRMTGPMPENDLHQDGRENSKFFLKMKEKFLKNS